MQSWYGKLPVKPGADGEADDGPAFEEANYVEYVGRTHEEPSRHVGGAGGGGGDDGSESASTRYVVVEILGSVVGEEADHHHCNEVDDHCDCLEYRCTYRSSFLRASMGV